MVLFYGDFVFAVKMESLIKASCIFEIMLLYVDRQTDTSHSISHLIYLHLLFPSLLLIWIWIRVEIILKKNNYECFESTFFYRVRNRPPNKKNYLIQTNKKKYFKPYHFYPGAPFLPLLPPAPRGEKTRSRIRGGHFGYQLQGCHPCASFSKRTIQMGHCFLETQY